MVGRTRPFGVGNGGSPTPVCGFLGEAGAVNCTPADSEEDAPTGYGGAAPLWDVQLAISNAGFSYSETRRTGKGKRSQALVRTPFEAGGVQAGHRSPTPGQSCSVPGSPWEC